MKMSSIARRLMGLFLLFLTTPAAQPQEWIYTVRPGDNIWNLTEEYLSDMGYWRRLQALNKVLDPEHLPPGSRLRIPVAWLRTQPAAARVLEVQGTAEATLAAEGKTVPVNAGLALHSGDEIRTGADGNVTLEFGDGSRLLLQAGSHLVMDTLSAYGETGMVDTRVRLQSGRVDNRTTPQKGSRTRYQIWTPAAVAAVRGTQYRVGAQADRPLARTEVISGRVSLSSHGKTRLIPARFGALARAGEAPQPPTPLLSAPDLAALPPLIERTPIRLNLPSLNGAQAYRVQIAPSDEFNTLLFDKLSSSAQIAGPDLADGDYTLRVRGIDSRGLEGLDAYHRFTLNARPQPPILIEPKPNAIIYDSSLRFQWSEPERAKGYLFQLADNPAFATPLLDTADYAKAQLTPSLSLQPGTYFWRVATRDSSGELGPFSDPQGLRLQPAPTVETPTVQDNTLALRWNGPHGQSYRIQLAKDREFEELLIATDTAEPQVRIPLPEPGFYYLRVQPLYEDGSPGPYGPTQRITVPARSYLPLIFITILTVILAL